MKKRGMEERISLFIPCLVDQVYPEIGLAMARVLRAAGLEVHYDARQTCCGQPAFNAGYRDKARKVAAHFLEIFSGGDLVVCPSGSCTAMVRHLYPQLFAAEPEKTAAVASRVFEFSELLCRDDLAEKLSGTFRGRVAFHDSCHSYRELGVHRQPRRMMQRVDGYELVEIEAEPVCCGFGGLFSFKFAPIAQTMSRARLESFLAKKVETIVSNDPGCILRLRQQVETDNLPVRILHLAEFLDRACLQPGKS